MLREGRRVTGNAKARIRFQQLFEAHGEHVLLYFRRRTDVEAAVRAVDPDPGRRRWLLPFAVVGAAVAASLMAGVITGPIGARIVEGCCISYDTGPNHIPVLGGLYVVVTCIPMMLSSYRPMIVFGVVNLIAVGLLGWLLAAGYASLWCAWAAVTSVLIAVHLRRPRQRTWTTVADQAST